MYLPSERQDSTCGPETNQLTETLFVIELL